MGTNISAALGAIISTVVICDYGAAPPSLLSALAKVVLT